MFEIFHAVVAPGDTYVFAADTKSEAARTYWLGPEITTWVAEDSEDSEESGDSAAADRRIVGMYKLIANRKDRGAHVANASFMVDPACQGRRIGETLGRHCLQEARRAGYLAMQFNYVVSTNTAAVKLWKKLGFRIIGTAPKAFRHETLGLVDVYVMHRFLD
jgi:ribosomal protein S18 acetylase RimI-like enzyme